MQSRPWPGAVDVREQEVVEPQVACGTIESDIASEDAMQRIRDLRDRTERAHVEVVDFHVHAVQHGGLRRGIQHPGERRVRDRPARAPVGECEGDGVEPQGTERPAASTHTTRECTLPHFFRHRIAEDLADLVEIERREVECQPRDQRAVARGRHEAAADV